MYHDLFRKAAEGDFRSIARCISLIENAAPGIDEILEKLPSGKRQNIIGVTGPPGAGKSTLVDGLVEILVINDRQIAVLCVDPSSPFHHGALLGDRIRMSKWYNHPRVFIRSLASRGSLGGLHPAIIEITTLLQACPFDYIIIETVGVGQSEVEVAGLADLTVVVLVPEAGDEVQTMKAGLMEIADIFVVNKSDRPDADLFVKNLRMMINPAFTRSREEIPVVKTTATTQEGLETLAALILQHMGRQNNEEKRLDLLTDRTIHLIRNRRMKDIVREEIRQKISGEINKGEFRLYSFIQNY
jgi:LAO/AO transport system kinase